MIGVYWLMRIEIDGREGFCFGVDENFTPRAEPTINIDSTNEADGHCQCYNNPTGGGIPVPEHPS
jgi:hypothetical protein